MKNRLSRRFTFFIVVLGFTYMTMGWAQTPRSGQEGPTQQEVIAHWFSEVGQRGDREIFELLKDVKNILRNHSERNIQLLVDGIYGQIQELQKLSPLNEEQMAQLYELSYPLMAFALEKCQELNFKEKFINQVLVAHGLSLESVSNLQNDQHPKLNSDESNKPRMHLSNEAYLTELRSFASLVVVNDFELLLKEEEKQANYLKTLQSILSSQDKYSFTQTTPEDLVNEIETIRQYLSLLSEIRTAYIQYALSKDRTLLNKLHRIVPRHNNLALPQLKLFEEVSFIRLSERDVDINFHLFGQTNYKKISLDVVENESSFESLEFVPIDVDKLNLHRSFSFHLRFNEILPGGGEIDLENANRVINAAWERNDGNCKGIYSSVEQYRQYRINKEEQRLSDVNRRNKRIYGQYRATHFRMVLIDENDVRREVLFPIMAR